MHHVPLTPAAPPPTRPCWHCRHFRHLIHDGRAAWCLLPRGPRVQAGPAFGCSAFEREPGSDDEPGPPGCLACSTRLRPVAAPAVAVAWAP